MPDNYAIQVAQAQKRFLGYDQQALTEKFGLRADESYLYLTMLSAGYRLRRRDGNLERLVGASWRDANTHAEVMTLLDLLCDSKPDRHLSGRYRSMTDFGLMFHQNLLEECRDPLAALFDRNPERLRDACRSMGGVPFPGCDIGYAVELFDGLPVVIQFWHGDEEFMPRLRYLWDENALQYLRYETMYYAVALLKRRLTEPA